MAFLRFVGSSTHPDSGVKSGLFDLAYALQNSNEVSAEHRRILQDHLAWFEKRLPTPRRFNRSSSKGYYRRATKGIAWFRDTAIEYISRMHEMKRVVEANGYVVELIRAERIGYVVYEDEAQVVAEPFADTNTNG
jgi:hypothetical protein